MKKQLSGILILMGTTIIWGSAFIAQSVGMDKIGPFTFQAIRCLLAVLFLFLGGVLPLALYACPLLASACLLPVREECRASYQWCCFFAAAILGLLLGPDKESALLFCFLGYYPLVQPSLDAIGSRALRFLTKLGLYVLAVGAMYALLVFVFRLDAVTAELAATAPWLIAATFALGAVLLFLYDELLRRFARLYRRRKRG